MNRKRVLCIWLPNWPVQRIQAVKPQLAKRPLVLSARDARRGLLVVAANLQARQGGIKPAMRLSEASALMDIEIAEHDPDEDISAICSLAEQAQQFSPIVGLEQLDKKLWAGRSNLLPESLLLDITGIPPLFGGEEKLQLAICDWLASQHYFGCVATASSVGAAWALANYAMRSLNSGESETQGKIQFKNHRASSHTRPTQTATHQPESPEAPNLNAQSVAPSSTDQSRETDIAGSIVPACRYLCLTEENENACVGALPLAALRLEPQTIQSLHRLAIYRIAQLAELPRAGMASRLGAQLMRRWDQATGCAAEAVVALHSLPDWNLEHSLEYPTDNRETLAELARRLCSQLATRLERRGEGVLRLVCRLDVQANQPIVMQLSLFRPTCDAQHLELLLDGQLEQHLGRYRIDPVWRLCLQATLTAPLIWRQAELFDGEEAEDRQQVARLVDTLANRLGRRQVLRAQVRRESQPELACSLTPLTGRRPAGDRQDTVRKLSSRLPRVRAEPSRDDPLRRPTHLLSPPVAIELRERSQRSPAESRNRPGSQISHGDSGATVESAADKAALAERESSEATAKIEFKYLGSWHEVVERVGPERLESGWWRGPSVRRDYYRAITTRGSWWWIYRDLNTNQWFLHGLFD